MSERDAIVAEKFWSRVNIGDPASCWEWQGPRDHKGYGRTSIGWKNRLSTHIALELSGHVRPGSLYALHTCDNPPCVNPAHLRWGTAKQNTADARSRKRLSGMSKTHCKHGHEYTSENTIFHKEGTRQCGECHKRQCEERKAETQQNGKIHRKDWEFCPRGHPFDEQNTYTTRDGGRRCRECLRMHRRAWKQRKLAADAIERGDHLPASVAGDSRLDWNIPDNLRWLAEQPNRPPRVPCGYLTGQFLKLCADRWSTHAAEVERLREALETIRKEAERENGGWVHPKRVIAIAARQALEASR